MIESANEMIKWSSAENTVAAKSFVVPSDSKSMKTPHHNSSRWSSSSTPPCPWRSRLAHACIPEEIKKHEENSKGDAKEMRKTPSFRTPNLAACCPLLTAFALFNCGIFRIFQLPVLNRVLCSQHFSTLARKRTHGSACAPTRSRTRLRSRGSQYFDTSTSELLRTSNVLPKIFNAQVLLLDT